MRAAIIPPWQRRSPKTEIPRGCTCGGWPALNPLPPPNASTKPSGPTSSKVFPRLTSPPASLTLPVLFASCANHFRRSKPDFFRELKHGPHSQPKKDAVRELILGMRKQNLSIYDIERALKTQQTPLSTTAIWEILHEAGFARLPRRQDEERPATLLPTAAAVA